MRPLLFTLALTLPAAGFAQTDTQIATADVTVSDTLQCTTWWDSSQTANVVVTMPGFGTATERLWFLCYTNDPDSTGFDWDIAVTRTAGAAWAGEVAVGPNVWDEGTFGNSTTVYTGALYGTNWWFDVEFRQVTAPLDPGAYTFQFTHTATAL